MPKIISAATANAPFKLYQKDIKELIYSLFNDADAELERMFSVFDNSNIQTRYISVDPNWLAIEHNFEERNKLFAETSKKMAFNAINSCLDKAGAEPQDIDCIINVTSTGVMTPTLDAVMFNEIGFNEHIKRIPLWGLGCAGGASSVSRAMDYLKAYPEQCVLILAIELCSLTFQKNDRSKSNIVASSLFGDGCACVLTAGSKHKLSQKNNLPELLDSQSTIYQNSLDVMGWDIVESGFSVVFSRDIPAIVQQKVKPNIEELIEKLSLSINNVKHFIAHPGGLKVINAYEQALGLADGYMKIPRDVLKNYGNMSSPSVLYVLNEFLESNIMQNGDYGLISSLGPGFSSELCIFIIR
jgi:alkylresorcinol/alkylpyrone synthase